MLRGLLQVKLELLSSDGAGAKGNQVVIRNLAVDQGAIVPGQKPVQEGKRHLGRI